MNSSSVYSGAERRINNSPVYLGRERRTSAWNRPLANDESTLIQYASAHDREAFARLYDRYVDRIYKYMYYRVATKSEAEDLTGQVFFKAWESIGNYRAAEKSFAAWLYGIAHEIAMVHARPPQDSFSLGETPQSPLTSDLLKRAIANLDPAEQQVIILRFIEGYSIQQTAEVTGESRQAIRSCQHRALVKLGGVLPKRLQRV